MTRKRFCKHCKRALDASLDRRIRYHPGHCRAMADRAQKLATWNKHKHEYRRYQ